jgi:peptide/nickel transport system ATP-binding protein
VEAVKDISFQLYRGETIAIVGESGSGKSVTARTVMGLLSKRAVVAPKSTVEYDGANILKFSERERRKLRGDRISMIFQEPMSSLNPIYTIGSQIVEAIRVHRKMIKKQAEARALELLKACADPRSGSAAEAISASALRRPAPARHDRHGAANEPDVLIADEPTTALDVTVQAQILNLIRNLQKEMRMAVILITHDLTVVRQFSDYVYVMQHGEMREHNTTEKLFANPQHAYTKHLLASEPKGQANPLPEGSDVILDAKGVRVSFMMRHGTFFKPELKELVAVDSLEPDAAPPRNAGPRRRIRFGQDDVRPGAAAAERYRQRRDLFRRQPIHGKSRAEMRPLRSRMQIVFQDPFSSLNPRMTIGQIIEEGLVVNRLGANQGRTSRPRARGADRSRHARQHPVALPARILGRPAPAYRHCPRHRARAGIHPARRADIGARPLRPGADHRTAAQAAGRAGPQLSLHLARSQGRACPLPPRDRHAAWQDRGRGPVNEVLSHPKTAYTERLVKAAFEVA